MSDIRIKMAKDLRDMSDMVGDLHWMAAKAVEDLSKKDGEIAKRDEELAACRVAVENCELFRARIAELEARIVWLECEAQVNAAPVSEAKAQGVVMQSTDGGRNPRYEGLFDGETEEQRASRLNAASVQQPKCKTCNDNGRIGGPSFYAPDEGGEPCPDCSATVQQVSVPDGFRVMNPTSAVVRDGDRWEIYEPCGSGGIVHEDDVRDWVVRKLLDAIAAAPAAPAADADHVFYGMDGNHP